MGRLTDRHSCLLLVGSYKEIASLEFLRTLLPGLLQKAHVERWRDLMTSSEPLDPAMPKTLTQNLLCEQI